MNAPYNSKYYEINQFYERYGNFIIPTGTEFYLYIIEQCVPGIEPYRYSISNKLNVFDYKLNTFVRISNLTLYPSINLYNMKKGKIITSSLHRVYMMTFCYFPGCENYEVNHIDGNKSNNHPSNLEWMTHEENMNHASEYLTPKKLLDEDIVNIIDMYNNNETFKTISNKFNISQGYVNDIVKGRIGSRKMIKILNEHPITRDKPTIKISDKLIEEAANRYNNGEEYFELAEEYGVDRSHLTKCIKRYAEEHPEIIIRPLKKFTKEIVNEICKIFDNYSYMDSTSLYNLCIDSLGIENTPSNRKALSNIYNGKTHVQISSKYKFRQKFNDYRKDI